MKDPQPITDAAREAVERLLAPPRRYLVATYDITDLSDEERDALAGEVAAQAERSDGHPSVACVIGETAGDAKPRFVGYFRSQKVEGTLVSVVAAPSDAVETVEESLREG